MSNGDGFAIGDGVGFQLPSYAVPQKPQLSFGPELDHRTFSFSNQCLYPNPALCASDKLGGHPVPLKKKEHSFPSSVPSTVNDVCDDDNTLQSATTAPSSQWSDNTPRLSNLLLPGTDLNTSSPMSVDYRPTEFNNTYPPNGFESQEKPSSALNDEPADHTCLPSLPSADTNFAANVEEDVEDIVREPNLDDSWLMPITSPSMSSSSSSSGGSCFDILSGIFNQPKLHFDSEEMLTMRFDGQTCGILSIKDGPTENPWRTMLWPLAKESPALRFAINAMTAFHASQEIRDLRLKGIENMNSALRLLAKGIGEMRIEIALAVTLVLAWAESWDLHISTGIAHLRGARKLVIQALMKYEQGSLSPKALKRLHFLCNTWVYMDVIARLTSTDGDQSEDFDIVLSPMCGPSTPDPEIDPLMGCASTLFPLIGRVANLVRKVRTAPRYSFDTISEAAELRLQISKWKPPRIFAAPQDVSLEIKDSLKTAEAYRWATLLYLHQAVPEASSDMDSAAAFAKKVLENLAAVPISSRAVIIHIYPLLAAGCEAEGEKDRSWVADRWTSMIQRMQIGNLNACWKVVKEVWDRRDSILEEKKRHKHQVAASRIQAGYIPIKRKKRKLSVVDGIDDDDGDDDDALGGGKRRAIESAINSTPPTLKHERSSSLSIDLDGDIEREKSVHGRLHWVGVMKDWKWEGKSNARDLCYILANVFQSFLGKYPPTLPETSALF